MTTLTFPEIIFPEVMISLIPFASLEDRSTAPDQRACLHSSCWQDTGGLLHCRRCGMVFYQDSMLKLIPREERLR